MNFNLVSLYDFRYPLNTSEKDRSLQLKYQLIIDSSLEYLRLLQIPSF